MVESEVVKIEISHEMKTKIEKNWRKIKKIASYRRRRKLRNATFHHSLALRLQVPLQFSSDFVFIFNFKNYYFC